MDMMAAVIKLSSLVWSRKVHLSLDDAVYVYARAAERGMEGKLLRMRCGLLRTADGVGISKGSGCGSEFQKKWKGSGIQCLVARFARVLPVRITTEGFQQTDR
jgi:hypothetical protein